MARTQLGGGGGEFVGGHLIESIGNDQLGVQMILYPLNSSTTMGSGSDGMDEELTAKVFLINSEVNLYVFGQIIVTLRGCLDQNKFSRVK